MVDWYGLNEGQKLGRIDENDQRVKNRALSQARSPMVQEARGGWR